MKKLGSFRIILILILFSFIFFHLSVSAEPFIGEFHQEDEPPKIEVVNPYFAILRETLSDGTPIVGHRIGGPPDPPPEYEEYRLASMVEIPGRTTIADFPSYDWVFGCSAVSGAMIAGYYDRNGYPNMYIGLTNGGVMPLTDTSWPTWFDVEPEEYPNNPLVASHYGMDGRMSYGSIDNYWVSYGSEEDDPYITNGWLEHTWETAIGDFMKTSQSPYGNPDGQTWFWNLGNGQKYNCSDMEISHSSTYDNYISNLDGTYGRKLFYEARGYTVGECYNQYTDNIREAGFSLADFQAEIDAGHPVMLNLDGHTIVGFGYSGTTIYVRDTWDSDPGNIYTMTWGGIYPPGSLDGMELLSVSIVHLVTPPPTPDPVLASDGAYADKVRVSWLPSDGATSYEVYRNLSDTPATAQRLVGGHPASPYDDITAAPGNLYYYWVKACNSDACSDYSSVNTGFRQLPPPLAVMATDGAFTNKVQISWDWLMGATYYQIFRNITDSHGSEVELGSSSASPYDDDTAVQGTSYYYWVKGCNALGCSDYSVYDTGYVTSTVTPPSAPASVSASDGTYTDKVFIDWPPVIGAAWYEVYRNDINSHTDQKTLTGDHPTSSYNDTNAEPGSTYYYWVRACNAGGCSDYSKYDTGWRGEVQVVYPIYIPLTTIGGTINGPLANGDFEQGSVDWMEYSTHGWDLIIEDFYSTVPAHGGNWLVWLGGDFEDTSFVSQNVTILPETPYLHFWYWIGSYDTCGHDFFRVKIDSVPILTKNLCSSQGTGGWVEGVVNLSVYVGSNRILKFEVTTDDILNSNFFLDDVSLSGSSVDPQEFIVPIEIDLASAGKSHLGE